MKDVDGTDAKRWGVTKFSEMKILCSHIVQLVDRNRKDINNNLVSISDTEGVISGGYYK